MPAARKASTDSHQDHRPGIDFRSTGKLPPMALGPVFREPFFLSIVEQPFLTVQSAPQSRDRVRDCI